MKNDDLNKKTAAQSSDAAAPEAEDITIDAQDESLDDSVVVEESAGEAIKSLREKLKKAVAEKQEYLTGWQKDKAEFVNARKRDAAERLDIVKYANMGLVEELVPVLNSFDMAMGNKDAWEKADKNWRIGVEYIANQLRKVLTDNGLVEIDPIGKAFDAARDEAISYESVADEKLDHVVVKVIQKGYSLNGKPVKAPKVILGEFKK